MEIIINSCAPYAERRRRPGRYRGESDTTEPGIFRGAFDFEKQEGERKGKGKKKKLRNETMPRCEGKGPPVPVEWNEPTICQL